MSVGGSPPYFRSLVPVTHEPIGLEIDVIEFSSEIRTYIHGREVALVHYRWKRVFMG